MAQLVSIIVPVYNRASLMVSLLGQIFAQTYPDFEVIIVDDCSSEDMYAVVQKYPLIKYIRLSSRRGPSYARNIGLKNAKGKYVLFSDSDIEMTNNKMIETMVARSQDDALIGQLGGELSIHGNERFVYGENISTDGKTYSAVVTYNEDNRHEMHACDFIPTSNCFVAKDKIMEVNGFDTDFIFYGEDKDLGYKLRQRGYQNFFSADMAVIHHFCNQATPKDAYFYSCRSRFLFIIKHKGFFVLAYAFLVDFLRLVMKGFSCVRQFFLWRENRELLRLRQGFHGRNYNKQNPALIEYCRALISAVSDYFCKTDRKPSNMF